MAYTKQVVWYYPYSNTEFMPIGQYGLSYTKILVDVPLYNLKRDVWKHTDTLDIGLFTEGTVTTLQTSTSYLAGTLEVLVNGVPITFQEDTRKTKRNFKVITTAVQNKYVQCSYIPGDLKRSLGNNKKSLEKVFGVKAGIKYSNQLRNTLILMRRYVSAFSIEMGIRPPIWFGGSNNFEVGAPENLLPFVTPASVELHLQPIEDKVEEIRTLLFGEGFSGISPLVETAYNLSYLESLQKVITEIDAMLETRSEG